MPKQITCCSGSDFAGCLQSSESTSSCKIFYGKHLLNCTSTTQAVVSFSSAEAEFYAAVKATAAGIGCVSMMRDLGVIVQQQGVEVKAKWLGDGVDSPSLEIKLDATAGRAIAMRRGAESLPWLQRCLARENSSRCARCSSGFSRQELCFVPWRVGEQNFSLRLSRQTRYPCQIGCCARGHEVLEQVALQPALQHSPRLATSATAAMK